MSEDASLYRHWISQIDNVILTKPNLDAILDVILEAIKELSDATDIDILLAEGERLHLVRYLRPWQDGLSSVVENEHGVVAWVAKNRKTVLIHDVSKDEPWKDIYVPGLSDVCSELAVPILGPNNELIGVINLEHTKCNHFTEEIGQKIESIAQQAAIGIDRARRAEELQRINDERNAIRELEDWLESDWKKVDERELYRRILEFAIQITGADVGDVIVYNPSDEKLRALVAMGRDKKKLTEMELSLGDGIVGLAAKTQRPITVPDVTEDQWREIYRPVWPDTKSELAVPIVDRRGENNYLIGVINLESSRIDHFRDQDVKFVQELARRARRARRRNLREAWLDALVGLGLSAMKLDTHEEIVRLTLEKALELSKGTLADLVKYDKNGNVLGGWAAERDETTGALKDFHAIPDEDFPIYAEGIMAQVARTKQAYLSNDVTRDEWYKPDPKQPKVRSELAVPLMRDENTLYGVFNVECSAANAFAHDDIELYQAISERLAPVLVLAEERYEREMEQVIIQMAEHTSTLRHDMANRIGLLRREIDTILRSFDIPAAAQERLRKFKTKLSDIMEMLRKVRDLGDIISEDMDKEVRIFSVVHLLEEIEDDIHREATNLEFVTHKQIPPSIQVKGPYDSIYLSLKELITNAIKAVRHVPDALITITATADDEMVFIAVTDNGPGVPIDMRPRIFDPFISGRNDYSTGFGLWIIKRSLNRFGGDVILDDSYAGGARFVMTLPRYCENQEIMS